MNTNNSEDTCDSPIMLPTDLSRSSHMNKILIFKSYRLIIKTS